MDVRQCLAMDRKWHPGARTTREINQRGHADHIGKPRTCTGREGGGERPLTTRNGQAKRLSTREET